MGSKFMRNFIGKLLLLVFVLNQQPVVFVGADTIIKTSASNQLRGNFGNWDYCPDKTYAAGFQLKQERPSNENQDNNTYVNGIRLICASIGQNNFNKKRPSSLVGPRGDWTRENYCDMGTMNGFTLKYDKSVGATNMKAQCVGSKGKYTIEGGEINQKGSYSGAQSCGKGEAIDGLMTRVDTTKQGKNLAGLSIVEMRCRTIKPKESDCKVIAKYDLIMECNNLYGHTPLVCKYEKTVGTSKEITEGTTESSESETFVSLGVSVEASYGAVKTKVSTDTMWTSLVGSSSGSETAAFSSKEVSSSLSHSVDQGKIYRLYQVSAQCDQFIVNANKARTTDIKGPIKNPPPANLVCQKPSY